MSLMDHFELFLGRPSKGGAALQAIGKTMSFRQGRPVSIALRSLACRD